MPGQVQACGLQITLQCILFGILSCIPWDEHVGSHNCLFPSKKVVSGSCKQQLSSAVL